MRVSSTRDRFLCSACSVSLARCLTCLLQSRALLLACDQQAEPSRTTDALGQHKLQDIAALSVRGQSASQQTSCAGVQACLRVCWL